MLIRKFEVVEVGNDDLNAAIEFPERSPLMPPALIKNSTSRRAGFAGQHSAALPLALLGFRPKGEARGLRLHSGTQYRAFREPDMTHRDRLRGWGGRTRTQKCRCKLSL